MRACARRSSVLGGISRRRAVLGIARVERECGEEPRRTEEFAAYIKGILGGFNIARH